MFTIAYEDYKDKIVSFFSLFYDFVFLVLPLKLPYKLLSWQRS